MSRPADLAAAAWALVGVAAIFAYAVLRLGERGIETIRAGLTPAEWAALAVIAALTVYSEGVRALQRRWVPHLFERVAGLRAEPVLHRLLAPIWALSLIAAPRRSLLRAWVGLFAIVLAVILVRRLPEPWRGIVDFAVAISLGWGLVVMIAGMVRFFAGFGRTSTALHQAPAQPGD